jgi:hypothetical protein
LLELDSMKKTIAAVKRGLQVLRSFLSTIKIKASDIELTLGIESRRRNASTCVPWRSWVKAFTGRVHRSSIRSVHAG